MSKRNRRGERDYRYGRCQVCDGDVDFESSFERGDIVSCSDCGAEYIIRALQPVRLKLIEEEPEEDEWSEEDRPEEDD